MLNRQGLLQGVERVAAGLADDIHCYRIAGNTADADLLEQYLADLRRLLAAANRPSVHVIQQGLHSARAVSDRSGAA